MLKLVSCNLSNINCKINSLCLYVYMPRIVSTNMGVKSYVWTSSIRLQALNLSKLWFRCRLTSENVRFQFSFSFMTRNSVGRVYVKCSKGEKFEWNKSLTSFHLNFSTQNFISLVFFVTKVMHYLLQKGHKLHLKNSHNKEYSYVITIHKKELKMEAFQFTRSLFS